MGKDVRSDAEKELNKAEFYYEGEEYKKAGKYFNTAGDLFYKLKEFKIAKECYSYASKSFEHESRLDLTIEALRNAGDVSILIDDYDASNKFFKSTFRFIAETRRKDYQDFNYLLFSSLSYLSLFVEGKQDQGLDLIKQIKKEIDDEVFKDSPYIRLVKNLTIASRDRNEKYLERIHSEIDQFNFSESENKLLKFALAIAMTNVLLKINLDLDKQQYTTKDIMNLTINIDTSPLVEISKNNFYNFTINEVKINNISLSLSDNITAQNKPGLPLSLRAGDKYDLKFALKTHFQLEDPYIGPITLSCELNNKFIFYHQINSKIKPKIISPPPSLDVSMKNLRTPLIDQSFPMEFYIENHSEGDALDLNLEIQFPEQLKVMRGTTKKQIYSLSSNDKITWEITLKPIEMGDYTINMDLKFKDPDQNLIEEKKSFPFSIKL
jgi:tetratricopeptide (TPR) repeat protein